MAARSKAWVCGRSPAETVGSNPTGGIDICQLWVLSVLSGRVLCDELITRPEESYRLWCVIVRDLETSWMRRSWPTGGLSCQKQTNKQNMAEEQNQHCQVSMTVIRSPTMLHSIYQRTGMGWRSLGTDTLCSFQVMSWEVKQFCSYCIYMFDLCIYFSVWDILV